jgi:hypothetical protein
MPSTCPCRPPRTEAADAGTRAIAMQGAMSSDRALATDVYGYIRRAGLRGNIDGPTSGQQTASNETTPAIVAVFTEGHPEIKGHVARIPKGRTHVRHRLLVQSICMFWPQTSHIIHSVVPTLCKSHCANSCNNSKVLPFITKLGLAPLILT